MDSDFQSIENTSITLFSLGKGNKRERGKLNLIHENVFIRK